MTKVALITGITGQDGAYLAEFLLNKGYVVHGVKRRTSLFNTDRIDHLYQDPHVVDRHFILHHGDMTDSSSLIRILQQVRPDELYNLAAQSHVAVSFEEPEYTADSDALGTLRLLEAIRILGLEKKTRFYQASTSELYGLVQEIPQKETTPFYPRSPYAVAKLYAYWITVNYREAYGIYACNGILFNHECISGSTPLLIRKGQVLDIVAVEDLVSLGDNGPKVQYFDTPGLEIWDGRQWTPIRGITATKRRKDDPDHRMISVEASSGIVRTTAHHSLLDAEARVVKAGTVVGGMRLLLASELPLPNGWTVICRETAEFLGLLTVAGHVPKSDRALIQFTHRNHRLGGRVAELWSRLFLGNAEMVEGESGFSDQPVGQLSLSGTAAQVQWLRGQLYDPRGYKRVPPLILNATAEIQAEYLQACERGDGRQAGDGAAIRTNSPLLAQGLYWLYANQGKKVSVHRQMDRGRDYYLLDIEAATALGNEARYLREDPAEVRRAEEVVGEMDEWVFDLETGSGVFLAGVGRVVIHNSPIRGETFVTRKITRALARIALGLQDCLYLGNLSAKRDWGHARDYVEMQWLMLQQEQPEDFVIASGVQYSVREFVERAAGELGIRLAWEGEGEREVGRVVAVAGKDVKLKAGDVVVRVDPRYFRPTEVETLLGDATKAREKLGWVPKTSFEELVREMVQSDYALAKRDALVKMAGFTAYDYHE